MKTKLISSLKIIGVELLGSILIAVGIYNFAAASAFPMTGFSGIALIFNRLFALPVGLTIIVWANSSFCVPCAVWSSHQL